MINIKREIINIENNKAIMKILKKNRIASLNNIKETIKHFTNVKIKFKSYPSGIAIYFDMEYSVIFKINISNILSYNLPCGASLMIYFNFKKK